MARQGKKAKLRKAPGRNGPTDWLRDVMDRASKEVATWSPQKRAAFELRAGVELPKK